MKAAKYYARGDLRVVDVPKPEPNEREALVAVEWCGICGSDLHEYEYGEPVCRLSPSSFGLTFQDPSAYLHLSDLIQRPEAIYPLPWVTSSQVAS
jgi:hypothetical protein